jgi:uncharacterized membrane protein
MDGPMHSPDRATLSAIGSVYSLVRKSINRALQCECHTASSGRRIPWIDILHRVAAPTDRQTDKTMRSTGSETLLAANMAQTAR